MPDWTEIDAAISRALGREFRGLKHRAVGGGCINTATVVESNKARYFVKVNRAERLWMFEAEAKGLVSLAATSSVTVPAPVCTGVSDGDAFLVLEYLPLGRSSTACATVLGAQLAALHALPQPCFGFESDNAIGSTPQHNPRCEDWVGFFRRHRLEFQLALANETGQGGSTLQDKGARLCDRLGGLFCAPIVGCPRRPNYRGAKKTCRVATTAHRARTRIGLHSEWLRAKAWGQFGFSR